MADPHRVLYFSTQFPTLRSPNQGMFSLQRVLALTRAGCDVAVVSPFEITPTIIQAKPVVSLDQEPGAAALRNDHPWHPCLLPKMDLPT